MIASATLYPAFAADQPAAGVSYLTVPAAELPDGQLELLPSDNIQLAHKLINPHVHLTGWLPYHRGKTVTTEMTLLLTPSGGRENSPRVTFYGAPRRWWDHDDAIYDTSLSLDDLHALTTAASARDGREVIAELSTDFGRAVTFASSHWRGRGPQRLWRRSRRVFVAQIGYPSKGRPLTYENARNARGFMSDTVIIDAATLTAAVAALRDAAAAAETIAVPYEIWRKTTDRSRATRPVAPRR